MLSDSRAPKPDLNTNLSFGWGGFGYFYFYFGCHTADPSLAAGD